MPIEPDKTFEDLEWERIVQAVASRCRGPLHESLEGLPLARSFEAASTALEEAAEAKALLDADEPLPLDGLRDVRRAVDRCVRGGDLDGPALYAVASTLGAARGLRLFLSRRRERAPALFASAALDPTLDALASEIEEAVEPDGVLRDHASPELRRLRAEVANLRARIVRRLEALLVEQEALLSDRFYTLREGRYVVPVRTDAHERLPGIVHGTSGSGATAFVEPRAIIAQGNRLKMAQGELEREEARILGALSARVRERGPELGVALDVLDRMDLRQAAARLAVDLGGTVPTLLRSPSLRLVGLRHPILVLDGVDVVQSDVELSGGRALVVSGPNAGGKTVVLKGLGLVAAMARAGLPVPAEAGSEVGYLAPILTDIGDDQSLGQSLSTFSAHVRNLSSICERSGPSALVLLDEVATGTDPEEGAALARALVETLVETGAAVAVSTHYEPLKVAAARDARFRNAAVGFDIGALAPTFTLEVGLPGASSALHVARRFGLPDAVVERAEALRPEGRGDLEALLASLEAKKAELEEERESAAEARRSAERDREAARGELERVRRRDKAKLSEEAERLLSTMRRVERELKDARRELRRRDDKDETFLQEIRRRLDDASRELGPDGPIGAAARESEPAPAPGEPPPLETVAPGARFFAPHLKTEVEVVEAPRKGRARVAAGPVKLWVDVKDLRPARASSATQRDAAREPAPEPPAPNASPSADNTLDVRGMRVDDALVAVESFLDRMYGRSQRVAFVLHGLGSGALRDAIRGHLRAHGAPYVRRLVPGSIEEGGERLTAVHIH